MQNEPRSPLPAPGSSPSAVLYGRVSTDKQELSTQEERCRHYCGSQGLAVAAEFTDAAVSGSIDIWQRPGAAAMRQFLAGNPDVRHIVILKLDRLGRDCVNILNTVRALQEQGILLHVVDLGGCSISTGGPMGRFFLTMLAGVAELELGLIRERIIQRLDTKREAGELCGTIPYGFDAIETGARTAKDVAIRQLVDNPEELQRILCLVQLRAAGYSYDRLSKYANAQGWPSKRAGKTCVAKGGVEYTASGRWTAASMRKMLLSKPTQEWLATQIQPAEQQAA